MGIAPLEGMPKHSMRVSLAVLAVVSVLVTRAAGAIVGVLETPDTVASQISNLQGWAYTTTPGAELIQPFQVLIEFEPAFEVPCCSDRGDVQVAHPDAPLRTGFSAVFNWALVAADLGFDPAVARPAGTAITISVVVTDTAGGSAFLTKEVTVHALSDQVSFFRDASWAKPGSLAGDLKQGWCTAANGSAPGGGPLARLRCHHLIATRNDDVLECGAVILEWDRASQGFKQVSDCIETSRWAHLSFDGAVIDGWTGLTWELKTGTPGEAVRCDDEAAPDPLCDDPHHVNNIYNWGGTPAADDPAPSGSVFTRFLAQLNGAVTGADPSITTGCFAGHCDWRLPTAEELQTLYDPMVPDCGPPAPLIPCTTIPGGMANGFYWTLTTNKDDATEAVLRSLTFDALLTEGKGESSFVRAVRGGR